MSAVWLPWAMLLNRLSSMVDVLGLIKSASVKVTGSNSRCSRFKSNLITPFQHCCAINAPSYRVEFEGEQSSYFVSACDSVLSGNEHSTVILRLLLAVPFVT